MNRSDPNNCPNVLLIWTDQQRWDSLSCLAGGTAHTPNLDRLAGEGRLFTQATCNAPLCMPSRQSFFTGRYPGHFGNTTNGFELPEDTVCLQHRLAEAGYATAQLGKLHFKNHSRRDWSRPHPAYGFETITVSDEPGCYDDAYIEWVRAKDPSAVAACRCTSPPAVETGRVDAGPREPDAPYVFRGPEHLTHSAFVGEITADYVRQRAGAERPFFAVAGFYAPHAPIDPPQSFADRFAETDMPPPAMRPEDRERLGHTDAHWQTVRRYYAALVAHVDAEVGRILDALDATGLADNTLVIFTSDHGEHLGDHGRVAKGAPGYDSCLRVPLLMRWPGKIPAGERVDGPVELVDVHAAILEACGLGDQNPGPGMSCLRGAPGREAAFAEVGNPGGLWRLLRSGEWKYLVCEDGREELYDLAEDPGELRDLSGDPDHAERLGTMRLALLRRLAADVPRPVPKTGAY